LITELRTFTPKQVAEMIGATEWWLREKARAREIPHLRLGPAKIMFRATDVRAILDLSAVVPDPVDRHADAPQTDAEIADLETLGLDPRSLARRRGGIRRRA
jgi:hypothetical protein